MDMSHNSGNILGGLIPGTTLSLRERTYQLQREELAPRIWDIVRACAAARRTPLAIADFGCGKGYWLSLFERAGVSSLQLCGIDFDAARIALARQNVPGALFTRADCRATPFGAAAFDIVTQFTLFSSLIEPGSREAVAKEMMRILKPGGTAIWYDFFAPNPLNRRTRPVGRGEIERLFPQCVISLERTTLVPPLARLLCRCGFGLAALARIPWLRTHYLGVIEKPSVTS